MGSSLHRDKEVHRLIFCSALLDALHSDKADWYKLVYHRLYPDNAGFALISSNGTGVSLATKKRRCVFYFIYQELTWVRYLHFI
jgi:hypothetical protein